MSKPAHSKPSAAVRTVPMFEAAAQPPPAPPPLQLTLALAGDQLVMPGCDPTVAPNRVLGRSP